MAALIDPVSAGFLLFFNTVVAFFGTFGNILVIAAFFVSNIVRSTKHNYFLLSLAVADLLACLVCIPMWNFVLYKESGLNAPLTIEKLEDLPPAANSSLPKQGTDHVLNVYVAYHGYLDPLFGVASIANLFAVSVVRCFAIYFPVRYTSLDSMYFVINAFVFPWGIGLFSLLYLRDVDPFWGPKMILFVVVIYFIPLLIIIVLYALILKHVGVSRIYNSADESSKHVLLIGLVVGCFIVCWCPFFALPIVFYACPKDCPVSLLAIAIIKFLQYLNSLMNVFIYAWQCKDFREAFKKIFDITFKCCRGSRNEMEPAWKEMGVSSNSLAPVFSVEI